MDRLDGSQVEIEITEDIVRDLTRDDFYYTIEGDLEVDAERGRFVAFISGVTEQPDLERIPSVYV